MRTQVDKAILFGGLAALTLMAGCGGNSSFSQLPATTPSTTSSSSSSNSSAPPSTGSVVVFGQDAPVCDVISFTVIITGATLTPQGGGAPVSILSKPLTVDFAKLMDFSTVLNFASVPTGMYSQVTLTLANPQLVVLDVTKSPPSSTSIPTSLTTSTVAVSIQPLLEVTKNGFAGLELEFDLRKSVQTDSKGQVTGTVTPVFEASPSTESSEEGLGEIEDLAGIIQSVTNTSTNPAFSGSFTLQTGDGSVLTVNTTSSTEFDFEEEGDNGTSQLTTSTFVEVDAFVDPNGNIVAKEVEAEEQEDEGEHQSAFVGLITSVKRDALGKATQFTLFVRDEQPDESAMVPSKSTLIVNVSDSTRFKITAKGINEAGLRFDSSTLGLGQEVVVHAQAQAGATPPTVSARSVFLRLQSIMGNFATLLLQASGNAGAFTLVPCASLFKGQPITVLTFEDTAFVGISSPAALTAQPTLIVKGLLFFEQQPITVNGLNVTAPTWVFEAKKVHQLSQ